MEELLKLEEAERKNKTAVKEEEEEQQAVEEAPLAVRRSARWCGRCASCSRGARSTSIA